jgi:radical SAM protein with 4Fe4S-binding SPASM domain
MTPPRSIPTLEYGDWSRRVFFGSLERDGVIRAQMELTYRCNLRCRHCYTDCYNGREHFSKELTTPEIVRILGEMADLGILWLNFTGGEVFMRPDFFEIYDEACRKGFIVTLFTNATLLTSATVARLAQRPPFFLDVSCHSVDEDAFDRFTQTPGSFRQFLDGMERLKASGIPFRLKTKAMNWNKAEIPRIRAFVESFGLPFGFTTGLSPRLDGDLDPLSLRLSSEEIGELEALEEPGLEEPEACRERAPRGQGLIAPPPDRLYRCGCATNTIHVNAWGELGACTLEYERRASLRTHSLEEAIAEVFGEVRALRYRSDSPCRACQVFAYCEKSPTSFRHQSGDAEAAIRYDCDVALNRAERATGRHWPHPLGGIADD